MKCLFPYVFLRLVMLFSIILIGTGSATAKTSIGSHAYTGVYQQENDPTVNFYVIERDGKVILRSVWGTLELEINSQNGFSLPDFGISAKFSNLEDGKFLNYVESVEGDLRHFKRVQEEPSIALIYASNPSFTNFSHSSHQHCNNDHLFTVSNSNKELPERLSELVEQIESDRYGWGKQNSLLIYKDNSLILERYFNSWTRNDPHQVQSVSKSITSLLIGSLITEGKLSDVNRPIMEYLPHYRELFDQGKAKITLANFLNMAAGLDWDEWSTSYGNPSNVRHQELHSDDGVAFTLGRQLTRQPGKHFSYSGGYVSVVGEVVANIAKLPTAADYARNSVFKELCFKHSYWLKQHDGRTNTGGGAMMRPLDMLKLGKLMLDEGKWQGKQLIEKQWVLDSMNPATNPYRPSYTYFWWHEDYYVGKDKYTAVLARGWGGQEIAVIKDLDLVVVKTASNFTRTPQLTNMMKRFILPALAEQI
ncbi:serine hydrolase domain-containing protein [Vibrio fluminensis]|uniref:serine hydrolase domain-containing protein n=1 Tax=Vibrio fluminensis TaxID=2783614 RepID=UPI001886C7C2|nr:serine hydrolase [Vibrio fluminensis]